MDDSTQAILDSKPEKKTFLRKFASFMMYGGYIVFIALGLFIWILLSWKST